MTNRYSWNEGLTETEQRELLSISHNSKDEKMLRYLAIFHFGLSPRTLASKESRQRNHKNKADDNDLEGFFGCITGRH